MDISTLRRNFVRYEPPKIISVSQHPEALTLDETFFGRSQGWLVFPQINEPLAREDGESRFPLEAVFFSVSSLHGHVITSGGDSASSHGN